MDSPGSNCTAHSSLGMMFVSQYVCALFLLRPCAAKEEGGGGGGGVPGTSITRVRDIVI